jgi:hypothetical protein
VIPADPLSEAGAVPAPRQTGNGDPLVHAGQKAPPLSIRSLDDGRITSDLYEGHPLYVQIFVTASAASRTQLQRAGAVYPHYQGRIAFLAIGEKEPADAVQAFADAIQLPYRLGIDDGAYEVYYDPPIYPQNIFIDKYGIIRAIVYGLISPGRLQSYLSLIDF